MIAIAIVISIILIAVSCAGIFAIVGKHLHVIASIDVDSLPAERNALAKDRIITSRINRKFSSLTSMIVIVSEPMQNFLRILRGKIRAFYGSLLRIKEQHKRLASVGGASITSFESFSDDEKVSFLLKEASVCMQEENLNEAERRYIDAIGFDSHCVPCYKGLISVYELQKDWRHASEISEYVCKLLNDKVKKMGKDVQGDLLAEYAEALHGLSEIYIKTEELPNALACAKKAVKLQENNPKYLHTLVNLHILLKERVKAERALDLLRKANPENQKLNEIEGVINELEY